ncbi:MAG TPA: hypothetical protein VFD78_06325 [Chitinophagaceae bacterium]|nr:hypothetical protein [Chitinophagaceae bacterium]
MKKYFFILIVFISYSCNIDNCSKNLSFKLDYHLFEKIKINNRTYCELVNGALEGNEILILDLSKVSIDDFGSYQHGAVLIDIIDKITIGEYLKIISSLTKKEKKQLYYTIWAGLEFTPNPKYKDKRMENVFPELSELLSP